EVANEKDIQSGTNYIVVGGTTGRSHVNNMRNIAFMNVNDRGNAAGHETMHLFGLADRYHYVGSYGKEGADWWKFSNVVNPGSITMPMGLDQSTDAQYYGHETTNLMSNAGDGVTDMQWNIVFDNKVETS